jgi:hypothetical protein
LSFAQFQRINKWLYTQINIPSRLLSALLILNSSNYANTSTTHTSNSNKAIIMVLGFGKKDDTTHSTTHPTGTTGGTHAVGSGPVSGTGYNNSPEVNAHGQTGQEVTDHHVGGTGGYVAGQHVPGVFPLLTMTILYLC